MQPNISELRQAYSRGENITQLLTNSNPGLDRSVIIEIAYDIQSGSYTKIALESPGILKRYACEIYDLAKPYLAENFVILVWSRRTNHS